MSEPVKPPSRAYRSQIRREQAKLTRERIIEAAATLFLEHGYKGTTVARIAESAGVAAETVYAAFGGKRGLLEGVVEHAISDAPSDRTTTPEGGSHDAMVADMAALPTSRERLRAYVAFCCSVLARTSPFHAVLRGAADSEEFAVSLRARLLEERLDKQIRHLRLLVGAALRAGITLEQAAESFCALSSPEMHHLMTSELAWNPRAHEEWLARFSEMELLGLESHADG
ncbi:MAG TPA: TetR/AcrR family transcriptional regulator [Longimicrobium sp.]|jgi:AcrR family transcriptional regulator